MDEGRAFARAAAARGVARTGGLVSRYPWRHASRCCPIGTCIGSSSPSCQRPTRTVCAIRIPSCSWHSQRLRGRQRQSHRRQGLHLRVITDVETVFDPRGDLRAWRAHRELTAPAEPERVARWSSSPRRFTRKTPRRSRRCAGSCKPSIGRCIAGSTADRADARRPGSLAGRRKQDRQKAVGYLPPAMGLLWSRSWFA